MIKCGLVVLLTLIWSSITLYADMPDFPLRKTEGRTINLEWVKSQVSVSNIDISMKSNIALTALKRQQSAGDWNQPVVGVEYNIEMNEWMATAGLTIPFFGKKDLSVKIAENEYNSAVMDLNTLRREMLMEAKEAYWRFWWIDQAILVYHENIELMKRLSTIAQTQYISGKTTQSDTIKAILEISTMEKMLLELHQESEIIEGRLNELMGQDPATPLVKPERPTIQIDTNYQVLLSGLMLLEHPRVKSAEYAYDKSKNAVSMEKLEWFPDFMLTGKYGPAAGASVMLELEIPLFFNTRVAKTDQMVREQDAMKYNLDMTILSIKTQAKKAVTDYQTSLQMISLYEKKILPAVKQSLQITESAYITGKMDFMAILDSQRNFLNNNLDYYKSISEAGMAIAGLEWITGRELTVK